MKAIGYAKTVIESISGNETNGTLNWTSRSGDNTSAGSLNIKNIKVNSAGNADSATYDSGSNHIANTYAKKSDLLDSIYPVGSIYMSTKDSSPANFLGGTWERIEGKFLLGAGSGFGAGSTGGEATHTLT